MKLTLKVWRQADAKSDGKLVEYQIDNITEDASFLEMLDILNEEILAQGGEPIAFDHDCREVFMVCAPSLSTVSRGPRRATTLPTHA